jgi:hypothetical protein
MIKATPTPYNENILFVNNDAVLGVTLPAVERILTYSHFKVLLLLLLPVN